MIKLLLVLLGVLGLKFLTDFKLLNLKIKKKYIIYTMVQYVGIIGLYLVKSIKNINISFYDLLFILIGYIFLISIIFYFKNIKCLLKEKNRKYYLTILLVTIVISIFLEIFVFNFRFFQTMRYKPVYFAQNQIKTNVENEKVVSAEIEIVNINKKIKNLYLDVSYPLNYTVKIKATDAGNKLYFELPSREIKNNIDKSKYLTFNLSGESEKLLLTFSFHNDELNINNLSINNHIPMFFSSIRCGLLIIVIMFVFLFKSNSILYKKKLRGGVSNKKLILILLLMHIIIFSVAGNRALLSVKTPEDDTYNQLAESLMHGKTYIEDNKNHSEEILKELKNPYDTTMRDKIYFSKAKEAYLWDRAFYKGHYYVYFGVVPIVLFYIPYHIIFNDFLPTPFIVYLCVIVSIIGITLLLDQFIKKYYKNCSVGLFILLNLLLVYCTGLLELIKLPDMYTLPIAAAFMFTMLGLNLWLSILKSNKYIKTKLTLGSLCMALVAGCRPQFLVGSFLLVPILFKFFKEKKNAYKKLDFIKCMTLIFLAYIIVAIPLMYYNYIRFGSPFDFGANYNLTTNDMTVRGFKFSRIPLGIVMYLFNPVNFKNIFPYIEQTKLYTNYLGLTIYEPMTGGLFFTTLIFGVCLFLPKFKKQINNQLLYKTLWLMLFSALIIIIADTQMAGILGRYLCDFSWLFGFVTAIIILCIDNLDFNYKNIFRYIIFLLIFSALLYQFFNFFVSVSDKFKIYNIDFWLYFNYLIQFWL